MKDKKPFVIQFVMGIFLSGVGSLIRSDYYSTLLFATGCGLAFSAIVQVARIVYWQARALILQNTAFTFASLSSKIEAREG